MSHVPHELAEEFPEQREQIAALKRRDAHFARLAEQYHAVNRALHRMETRIEPASEAAEATVRKQRLGLKDEIAALLRG